MEGTIAELFAQPPGTRVAARAAARPFAVARHEHNGDVGDGGLRLDKRLDAGALGDPLTEIFEIDRKVTAAPARGAATPKPV